MRTLFITRGFPPKGRWGSEGYSHDLAKALAESGHEVAVFYPVVGAHGVAEHRSDEGILVHECSFQRPFGKPFRYSYSDPRQDAALSSFFKEHGDFDRVHFTALAGEVSLGLLPVARRHARELLVTLTELLPYCHRGQLLDAQLAPCSGPEAKKCGACVMATGPWSNDGNKKSWKRLLVQISELAGALSPFATPAAFRKRERFAQDCLSVVDLFLAPSEGLGQHYLELGLPQQRLRQLAYALDPSRYAAFTRQEQNGPLRLAYMGQLAPHKGVHVLVEAVERLEPALRQHLRIVLHGSATSSYYPEYGPALNARIAAGGLPVEVPGPFPPEDVAKVLSDCDVLLLPSLWVENLPLVLLHARACGLPILASDVGGIRSFIRDGEDGWLVSPGAIDAWTQRLTRLAEAGRDSQTASDACLELQRVREGAQARGVPMEFSEHLEVLSSLERLRALPTSAMASSAQ